MPPTVALACCLLFILWLFIRDGKRREVSTALWIPLTWAFIICSKPLSFWFGSGDPSESVEGEIEGRPFDRFVFLLLIAAGLFVLAKRGLKWSRFFRENRWVGIYFLYFGLSALWSDYSFVSFKRWIKDFGNIVMVLVVLSEERPLEAVKALLARCAYLLIPLSALVIKYYPDIGRYYDQWTYQPYFRGFAADKNLFGMCVFVCGLSLFWLFLELRAPNGRRKDKHESYTYLFLLVIATWLLTKTRSSTALTCTLLGCLIVAGMRFPTIRSKANRLGAYSIGVVVLVLFLHTALDLGGILVQLLGRDLTLTGRTDIWAMLLKEPINPLIGEGFSSFWMGDRVDRLSEKYFYHLNEAHNGYLETYLNGGLIGLGLLLVVLASAAKNIQRQVVLGSSFGALRLAFLLSIVIYGVTEAVFRFGPLWFLLLLLILQWPRLETASVPDGHPIENVNNLEASWRS